MEQAAHHLTDFLLRKGGAPLRAGGVRVLVGKGNNGGDGLAVARHLVQRGFPVFAWLAWPGLPDLVAPWEDARIQLRLATQTGVPLLPFASPSALGLALAESPPFAGVWVDALLGTGFSGALRPDWREVVERLNRRREVVFAVDVPSGLAADTGQPMPVAVEARFTGTLGALKRGFGHTSAVRFTGATEVLPIGWPEGLLDPGPVGPA